MIVVNGADDAFAAAVMALCRGLPHSLVLRDREGGFHVLVSNVRLHKRRPRNGSQPRVCVLVRDL